MSDLLTTWFGETTGPSITAPQIAGRLVFASLLGVFVAGIHRLSGARGDQRPSFTQTLVLLAPLISMVTLAVGQNVAAAFTLVGTLAIVRFRTVVRDTRDTVFVIFSVAVGMALGAANVRVAAVGCAVVGMVAILVRLGSRPSARDRGADVIDIVLSPPDGDPAGYAAVLADYVTRHEIIRSDVSRTRQTLRIKLRVHGLDPRRAPELLTRLLENPDVSRASFGED